MLAKTAVLCMLLGVVLSGCGGNESEPTPAPPAAPTPAPPIAADEWASVLAKFLSVWSSQDANALVGMFATEWSITRAYEPPLSSGYTALTASCTRTQEPPCVGRAPLKYRVTDMMFKAYDQNDVSSQSSIAVSNMEVQHMDVIDPTEHRYIWSVWRNNMSDGTQGAVSSLTFFNQAGLILESFSREWFLEPAENESFVAADSYRARTSDYSSSSRKACRRIKQAWGSESLEDFRAVFADDAKVSMYDGVNETYNEYRVGTLVDFWNDYFMAAWLQDLRGRYCQNLEGEGVRGHGLGYSELKTTLNTREGEDPHLSKQAAGMHCVIPVVLTRADVVSRMHCAVFFLDGLKTRSTDAAMQAWDTPTSSVATQI